MTQVPRSEGQLVWCPADPTLGVGVVTAVDGSRIHVKFLKLQEERAYTTRDTGAVVRYEIGRGERVRFHGGDEIRVEAKSRETEDALVHYTLEDGREVPESELVPEIRDVGAKERLASLSLAHPEVVRARLQGLRLRELTGRPGHASILGSRIEWLPHQIDVATRAIESEPVRRLLADEVGLGKTVEAAMIYAGLRAEGRANRVLILTPDALTIQWLGEIFRKAHDLFVLFDDARLDEALNDMPDVNPFEAFPRIACSLDWIVSDDMIAEEAAESQWDLVIVDEAHHLRWRPDTGGNKTYKLVEGLSRNTRHMLLLTATPMALDPAEYHALLRLLDPAAFDDPAQFDVTRSRVAAIRDTARGISAAVEEDSEVPEEIASLAGRVLADDEDDVKAFDAWLKEDAASRRRQAQEILDILRERHAIAHYVVRNRRGPVGGMPVRRPHFYHLEPSERQDALLEVGEGVILDLVRTMRDETERRKVLGQSLRALWATPRALGEILLPFSPELAAELAPHIDAVVDADTDAQGLPVEDARLRWLVSFIRELPTEEKVLVFVESPGAVRAVRDSLERVLGAKVAMFYRELSPRDQDRQVAWFREADGPQVMLSTEAGGEGRNFQFCHHVVLYDLPWRPATIEQRIGRIDRVGQSEDVQVHVPCFTGGYEAAILKVMQGAIGVFESTVGGIDHSLEFVSDRLADVVVEGGGAQDWKELYRETETTVSEARERIESGIDPILDHASFSPERVDDFLATIPENLEALTEDFVLRFVDANKLELHSKSGGVYAVEGAPGAANRTSESGYNATFRRTQALDHEELEFLSFGHPLLEQALEWAEHAHDASASLAIARGQKSEGAIFLWRFSFELPDDVPEALTFVERRHITLALDESGKRCREYERMLEDGSRPLDRMDARALQSAITKWRRLVDQNFASADGLAQKALDDAVDDALETAQAHYDERERLLQRSHKRALAGADDSSRAQFEENFQESKQRLDEQRQRVTTALHHGSVRLVAAVAVRLVRQSGVSA